MNKFQLKIISEDSLYKILRSETFEMSTVISFEERSMGLAQKLEKAKILPNELIIYDYDTVAVPESIDKDRRDNCREHLLNKYFINSKKNYIDKTNPFAQTKLEKTARKYFNESKCRTLLIDCTCMTRVHLLTMINAISELNVDDKNVIFFYMTPETYGFEKGVIIGWKDVILLPIGKNKLLKREGNSKGIIITGHNGERLSVALEALEPLSGTIVYARTKERPDYFLLAKEKNRIVSQHLLGLRATAIKANANKEKYWSEEIINIEDTEKMKEITVKILNEAREDRGPIIIYPFGPKILVLQTAITLAHIEDVEVWAVYPIPQEFDANYSRGYGKQYIAKIERDK